MWGPPTPRQGTTVPWNLVILRPLPTPGKKEVWGPTVASPHARPHAASRDGCPLEPCFARLSKGMGYNLLLYLTSRQRAIFAGISPLQYIAKGFESIELYRDKSSIL